MTARRLQKIGKNFTEKYFLEYLNLGVNVKYEETKNAMHNNFCWSQAFTGNELIRLGDRQVDDFIAGIKDLLSNKSLAHDEL